MPHVALQVPDDSLQEYLGKFDDLPYPGGNGYLPHFKPKAAYAAMITRMDREIGRMLALITELGLDKETIFVFVSDNGPVSGTHQGLAGTDAPSSTPTKAGAMAKARCMRAASVLPAWCAGRGGSSLERPVTASRVLRTGCPRCSNSWVAKTKRPELTASALLRHCWAKNSRSANSSTREFASYGGQQILRMGDWNSCAEILPPKARGRPKLLP